MTAKAKLEAARKQLLNEYRNISEEAALEAKRIAQGYTPHSSLCEASHRVAALFAQVSLLEELALEEVK